MSTYDLIAIGGGTAGLVTAAGGAGLGARVALVERDRLGGECLWNGCVPSKAILACARAAAQARDAARFGVCTGDVEIDFAAVMRWVHGARQRIAPHDSPERFRGLGVDVVEGSAHFVDERTVAVDGRRLSAKQVVIATGSRPAIPPVDGIADVPYYTNETIFEITRQPRALLILGAGPIGIEMGQAFARLGSAVTVVEHDAQFLPREDHELADLLAASLRADGVDIRLGLKATRVRRDGETITLTCDEAGGGAVAFTGDALLVAAGRQSRTAELELGRVGVETGTAGDVLVDDHLRTTADGIWAAGDVKGGMRFTHVADYDARLVLRNALFPLSGKRDYSVVPWVTFTEPELAHVGLTERQARERHGGDVRVWRRPFAEVDRAIADGETDGLVKLITDGSGKILGGHILGHGAGSLIAEIALAMQNGLPVGKIVSTIHPYPTYPEAIKQAAEQYRKSRFTGAVKSVVQWFARR
jgi:pyruvate/2-oxoglutarate dehydrogenase complex dihydrolipoamide dehydrogenase (E3) component